MKKTRTCLGWASVVLWGVMELSPVPVSAQNSSSSTPSQAPATASGAGSSSANTQAPANAQPSFSGQPAESEAEDQDEDSLDEAESAEQSGASDASDLEALMSKTKVSSEEKPDRYNIQPGDTLWDISSRFWGDPYFWPKLWSYNPYIGNAHLIYPGNVLRFYPGNYVRPPSMDFGGAGAGVASGEPRFDGQVRSGGGSSRSNCETVIPFKEELGVVEAQALGFIREQSFAAAGKIVKAPENKILHFERDVVYIQFSKLGEVQCGDKYTIYTPLVKKVVHPRQKKRLLGSLFRIVGEVQIINVNDYVATGRVTESFSEIRRGNLVTAHSNVHRSVEPKSTDKELDGYIVEKLNHEGVTLSTRDVIYIDRGEEDGIGPGHSFYVVRQQDGIELPRAKGKVDSTLPYQVIGKVVVLTPGEFYSEAVITESVDSIEVGDHLVTRLN